MPPAISMEGVRKVFRKRTGLARKKQEEWALKGITLRVEPGETYGLLGPNGSGKSTLIRILATLLEPDGGEVEVLGYRLPRDEREVRRRIGRVSVDAAYYKKLSARENLMFTAFLYGFDRATAEHRANDILERLGFDTKRFDDPLEEMSRGMQQKITITRALLIAPPLLLLDEPTTGLDPRSKREVQAFLDDLRQKGRTTILLTTHDMIEAERLRCDRLGLLAHGRLVAEGSAEDLRRQASAETLEDAFLSLTGEKLDSEEEVRS